VSLSPADQYMEPSEPASKGETHKESSEEKEEKDLPVENLPEECPTRKSSRK